MTTKAAANGTYFLPWLQSAFLDSFAMLLKFRCSHSVLLLIGLAVFLLKLMALISWNVADDSKKGRV